MKANEILTALNKPKNQHYNAHASQMAEIFKFFTSIRSNITGIATSPASILFGNLVDRSQRKFNGEKIEKVKYSGDKMEATKFTVTTNNAEYSISVPVNNAFHDAVSTLLGLPVEIKTAAPIKETIVLPGEVLTALKKAAKWVGSDALRPVMQNVLIEMAKGKAHVVATNAHALYLSQAFTAPKHTRSFLIPADKIKSIPVNTTCEICVISDDLITINGYELTLCTDKFPNYKVVMPQYTQHVTFDRKVMAARIKEVLPHANKVTKLVDFTFSDAIYLHTQDVDFTTQATRVMEYESKNVVDFSIAYNGRFLTTMLSAFEANKISMLHCGVAEKAGVFTDGIDQILLMPLARPEGVSYVPEAPPAPEVKLLPAPAIPEKEEMPAPPVETVAPVMDKPKRKERTQTINKQVVKTEGAKVNTPVELIEMGSIIKLVCLWVVQVRKAKRVLKCSYKYAGLTFEITGTTKGELEKILTDHGFTLK